MHPPACRDDAIVTSLARAHGYDLIQRETDTGNLVWTWRGVEQRPHPSFLTRGQAVSYMDEHLARAAA
jgi:hypothetical protein